MKRKSEKQSHHPKRPLSHSGTSPLNNIYRTGDLRGYSESCRAKGHEKERGEKHYSIKGCT